MAELVSPAVTRSTGGLVCGRVWPDDTVPRSALVQRNGRRRTPCRCASSSDRDGPGLVSSRHSRSIGRSEELAQGGALGLVILGSTLAFPELATAVELSASSFAELLANEPQNALSLPTWTIHVASVAEWVTAMSLVWQYGGTPGNAAWKGLAWGMVPLLGGAMCACTWHFFYNANSLDGLVVLQGALTLIGNFTMWIAAFRIYMASQEKPSS